MAYMTVVFIKVKINSTLSISWTVFVRVCHIKEQFTPIKYGL